ncbi:unnamed protein product [Caenorhabditis auriculariae]|uniref:Uncharacterized protein n=1 Tax=Caenorhabditis auriculariae TaxID=2777116 RepID=A0A8S1HCV4_9PELO|nr:unnamed protein product [Caenorhabditis auriculariae]
MQNSLFFNSFYGLTALSLATFFLSIWCMKCHTLSTLNATLKTNMYRCLFGYLMMDLAPRIFSAPIFYHESSIDFSMGLLRVFGVPLHIDWLLGYLIRPGGCMLLIGYYRSKYVKASLVGEEMRMEKKNEYILMYGSLFLLSILLAAPVTVNFFLESCRNGTSEGAFLKPMGVYVKMLEEPSHYSSTFAVGEFLASDIYLINMIYIWIRMYRTRAMHNATEMPVSAAFRKKQLYYSAVQMLGDVVFFFIPMLFLQLCSFFSIYKPELNNIAFWIQLFHGTVGMISFLFAHNYSIIVYTHILKPIGSPFMCLFSPIGALIAVLKRGFRSNRIENVATERR